MFEWDTKIITWDIDAQAEPVQTLISAELTARSQTGWNSFQTCQSSSNRQVTLTMIFWRNVTAVAKGKA